MPRNFDKPPEERVDNLVNLQPMTTTLMVPEEVPQQLLTDVRKKVAERWENLSAPRITRFRPQKIATNLLCLIDDDEYLDTLVATTVKAFLPQAGGHKVYQALDSSI